MISKGDLLSQGDQVFKVLAVIERPCLKLLNVGNEAELEIYQEELETQGYKVHHKAEDVTVLIKRVKELETTMEEIVQGKINEYLQKHNLEQAPEAKEFFEHSGMPERILSAPDETITG